MTPRPPLPDEPANLRWAQVDDAAAGSGQGELFETVRREVGRGEFRGMEFLHVRAQRIINEVKLPGGRKANGDVASAFGFRFTVNPYRGCSHACTYCFARPTHEYLGLNMGADFDQRIVVKVNAVERLRAELHPVRWAGDLVAMGTNTDPYQRCEGKYRLTRGIVETLVEYANPFSILTKSTLIRRDIHLLVEATQRTQVQVNLSIGTLDEHVWRATEPGTPSPSQRMRVVAQLNEAGVPCGVLAGPVIPGLSDSDEQLEELGRACVEAGAQSAGVVLLYLRPGLKEHFLGELGRTHPELLPRYARMYPGANAPKADQERVSRVLHAAIRRAGGLPVRDVAVDLGGLRPRTARVLDREAPRPSAPPAEQLALTL